MARIGHQISRAKNRMQTADMLVQQTRENIGSLFETVVANVYQRYETTLLESNAVDFDDLLLHVCALLAENDEIRSDLDARFRYILVDEYQDTNLAQYQMVAAMSRDYPHLCATGDPDQSIYGWRGGDISNILRFETDYPMAKLVRLEQNYRSTKNILQAADDLIAHNVHRKPKSLLTDNIAGEPVELLSFTDERHEANSIAERIRRMAENENRPWSDFAIFYRVNALSRTLEHALRRQQIPYQIASGVAFYERAEIKDLLAYLRLIHNPADRTAFLRIVNTPVRGIGKNSLNRLDRFATEQGLSLLDAARTVDESSGLKTRAVQAIRRFADMVDELAAADSPGVAALLQLILNRTGYLGSSRDSRSDNEQQRLANVEELLTAAQQYDEQNVDGGSLEGFLETTSLVADSDAIDDQAGLVTLMTLHAAKGLEFPVVFVMAVEHNILPHERSLKENNPAELEEERRLLFVGITRAEQKLFLTQTLVREFRGRRMSTIPSGFLQEMSLQRVIVENEQYDGGWPEFSHSGSRRLEDSQITEAEESWANPPRRSATRQTAHRHKSETARPTAESAADTSARPALMTAAEMLNGGKPAAGTAFRFEIGMSVRHPQLGVGDVVAVQGLGTWNTVKVRFADGEVRSYISHKCPLQPIGVR
jgi:DNA helicase-2/ATP-dependent DNA helicase PcrA